MKLFFKNELALSKKSLRSGDMRGNLLAIGTLEKTLLICEIKKSGLEILKTMNFFESPVYSVKFVSNNKLVIGCYDKNIYYLTTEGEILMNLKGHEGIVNSLSSFKNLLASGSWDNTCRIWDLETGACIKILDDHKFAVTCLFLENGQLLTGSQNGILHLWTEKFEKIKEIKAHDNIIREIRCVGNTIFTCSNDQTVRVWDLELNLMKEIHGHTSFIYTVCPLLMFKNSFISGGEDFKLKLYNNFELNCEINYPTTIWKIIEFLPNSEYYILGEDGRLRVFTTSEKSVDMDVHEKYISEANMASLKNPELTEEELKKYPTVDKLNIIKGKKEGEVKVFVSKKTPEAYMWKAGAWNLVGEVIGSNRKSKFEGDRFFPKGDYEFIFDIQDESGGSRLLPFNKQDNPLVAAEKFLAREELSVGYKEQIINFIKKNANIDKTKIERKPLDKFSQQQQTHTNQDNILKPQGVVLNHFPIVDNLFFTKFNSEAFLKKIKEINETYKQDKTKEDFVLTITDILNLTKMANSFGNAKEMYLHDIEEAQHTVITKLLNWKDENCFIIMDFFRMYALHRDSSHLLDNFDNGIKFIVFAAACSKYNEAKYMILNLRFFCNLFKENPNAFIKNQNLIFEFLSLKIDNLNDKCTSLLISIFNNYLCYYFANNKITSTKPFYQFLKKLDFKFLVGNSKETVNFIIALGNAILFQDGFVNNDIKTELKELINSLNCNPPHDQLLEEVKKFVNK